MPELATPPVCGEPNISCIAVDSHYTRIGSKKKKKDLYRVPLK